MITNKQKKQIKKLYKKGIKLREIARKLNLSVSTISYHTNEEIRKKKIQQVVNSFKKKTLEERKKIYKKRLPYLRKYQKRRYNEDMDFRTKKQMASREYYKKINNKGCKK
ncbi:MAG: helix-turn-helix domain-containing protein [Promethearchaeota archaeon]